MSNVPSLIITRGYPASGKTTWAKQWVSDFPETRARVSRDDLRNALYGAYSGLTNAQERAVTIAQREAVGALLKHGKSVVVDDTNLRLRTARGWCDMAKALGVRFAVWDIGTDARLCAARDFDREARGERAVGKRVVDDFAKRYPMPWPEVKPTEPKHAWEAPAKYVPDDSKPPAIIVDLDGTLAHNNTGRPWYGDHERFYEDDVDMRVSDYLGLWMHEHTEAMGDRESRILFVTGREDTGRAVTTKWLREKAFLHEGFDYHLFMRPKRDYRPDYQIKAELFDKHIRDHWNVSHVLDDRQSVVDMWRDMGLPVWQVAPGNH